MNRTKKRDLVSVIITTKNSAKTLGTLLKSLKKQTFKKIEVIVVDNHSSDNTLDVARKFTKNILTFGPERSAQRNLGAKKSRGRFLFFLDSDMILSPNVIKECLNIYKNNKQSVVGGVIIPEKSFGRGIWAKAKALERKINLEEKFFESARFFPKSVFFKLGGFDEELTGPEDWDLPQRIERKYKILRINAFIFHNEGNLKLFYLAKKKFLYGLSAYKYLKKNNYPLISPRTVYFLRPAFYKKSSLLFEDLKVSLAMFFMLFIENIAGFSGYIVGRLRK